MPEEQFYKNALVDVLKSEVSALKSELKYYKDEAKEKQEIIEQLHRGFTKPGDVVYIHPFDFAEIVNSVDFTDVFFTLHQNCDNSFHEIKGIRYKQSAFMPQYTKNIK